jgi:hypothetical protein
MSIFSLILRMMIFKDNALHIDYIQAASLNHLLDTFQNLLLSLNGYGAYDAGVMHFSKSEAQDGHSPFDKKSVI